MASFLCQVQTIQRGMGRSSVAAAAYRSGTSLTDERLAMEFDFSAKDGVEYAEVMAPAGTPSALQERGALWNAAEKRETRKDAVPAREVLLALPHELSFEQRRDLVRAFVAKAIVARGMIADVALHLPSKEGDPRNFHAHILVTTRRLEGDGFGKKEADWWSPQLVRQWREGWAQIQNEHLRRHLGPDAPQVTHLSLAERGIDQLPSVHQGPAVTALERKGVRTMRGERNRDVEVRNVEATALRRDFADTADRLAAAAPRIEAPISDLVVEARRVRDGLLRERSGFLTAEEALKSPRPPSIRQVEREVLEGDRIAQRQARFKLAKTHARVDRVRRSRLGLVAWVRNPTRMIFAKHAELNAIDKAQRDVRFAERRFVERQAWLKSSQGQAMIAASRQPALDQLTEAASKRRTLVRKIKRIDKRIEAATRTLSDLMIVQELGGGTLRVPAHSPDATRFLRDVGGGARKALARFPAPARTAAIARLNKGQGRGLGRSLFTGR